MLFADNLEMFQKAVISLSPENKRPKEKCRSSKLGNRVSQLSNIMLRYNACGLVFVCMVTTTTELYVIA